MYNNQPTRVLTGEVRLSYANLVSPQPNRNDPKGKLKYSVTLQTIISSSNFSLKKSLSYNTS